MCYNKLHLIKHGPGAPVVENLTFHQEVLNLNLKFGFVLYKNNIKLSLTLHSPLDLLVRSAVL